MKGIGNGDVDVERTVMVALMGGGRAVTMLLNARRASQLVEVKKCILPMWMLLFLLLLKR